MTCGHHHPPTEPLTRLPAQSPSPPRPLVRPRRRPGRPHRWPGASVLRAPADAHALPRRGRHSARVPCWPLHPPPPPGRGHPSLRSAPDTAFRTRRSTWLTLAAVGCEGDRAACSRLRTPHPQQTPPPLPSPVPPRPRTQQDPLRSSPPKPRGCPAGRRMQPVVPRIEH